MICANCCLNLRFAKCTGESGLYSPGRSFELCEPCWIEEDRLIDEQGNNIPDRLERYRANDRRGRGV
jgi:hypothetical protein